MEKEQPFTSEQKEPQLPPWISRERHDMWKGLIEDSHASQGVKNALLKEMEGIRQSSLPEGLISRFEKSLRSSAEHTEEVDRELKYLQFASEHDLPERSVHKLTEMDQAAIDLFTELTADVKAAWNENKK